MAAKCNCKGNEKYLKEQFINGINDDIMNSGMIKELLDVKKI